ncbi:hypothetical protein PITCH_A2010005 [uncultured Desulfobacterium sp.]|uniref:Uncharacterized protein n=1 Tax=uncultured Desulfobacterium sp. TaxID=201089 RepID=A0A445MWI9_9BACT|nr:hypothetical protein PITCH_A2010005 [uncultured Desulfobacterium sp.]
MEVHTAWVKPPNQIGGLDHLGVQAPCINLYGRMVPGITNVTDRARYYSFYPWVVWALEQTGFTKFNDAFIDHFRKADCLFSLIAFRHSHTAGENESDHTAAIIGSFNLAKQIADIREGKTVRISEYSHRDKGRDRGDTCERISKESMQAVSNRKVRSDGEPISFSAYIQVEWLMSINILWASYRNVNS